MKTLNRHELKALNAKCSVYYNSNVSVTKTKILACDDFMGRNSKVSCDSAMSRNSNISCDAAAKRNAI